MDDYTFEQQDDHQTTIGGVLVSPLSATNNVVLDENNYLGHREFFARYPDPSALSSSMPMYWTEFGDQIYFNCPVNVAYVLTQRYFRIPTDMSANDDVPDVPVTFRELLELWALYRAEKYRGNHDVAATYKQEFEDGLEAMVLKFAPATSVGPTIWRDVRRSVNRQDEFYDSL